jgi:hypothetical protein
MPRPLLSAHFLQANFPVPIAGKKPAAELLNVECLTCQETLNNNRDTAPPPFVKGLLRPTMKYS